MKFTIRTSLSIVLAIVLATSVLANSYYVLKRPSVFIDKSAVNSEHEMLITACLPVSFILTGSS